MILGLMCKLDLEKAYDRVSWGFLSCMLGEWDLVPSGGGGFRNVFLPLDFLY